MRIAGLFKSSSSEMHLMNSLICHLHVFPRGILIFTLLAIFFSVDLIFVGTLLARHYFYNHSLWIGIYTGWGVEFLAYLLPKYQNCVCVYIYISWFSQELSVPSWYLSTIWCTCKTCSKLEVPLSFLRCLYILFI